MIFLGKSGKPPINIMGAGNRAEFLCTDTSVEENNFLKISDPRNVYLGFYSLSNFEQVFTRQKNNVEKLERLENVLYNCDTSDFDFS